MYQETSQKEHGLLSAKYIFNSALTDFKSGAVTSRQREGDAHSMVGNANQIEFFVIDANSGTTSNTFPINSAGVLMNMNLYDSHFVHVFFPILSQKVYIETQVNRGGWSAWREI